MIQHYGNRIYKMDKFSENHLEGRNAVLEAFRSGKTVEKVFLQKDLQDEA